MSMSVFDGNVFVQTALARPNLSDPLDQLVEVVLAEALVQLESLVIEHESLDHKLF